MVDSFLFTILILVAALAGIFYYAHSSLNYFEDNELLRTRYERKKNLNSLAKKIQKLEVRNQLEAANRAPAAVGADARISVMTDARLLAQEYFTIAKVKCYELKSELDCLQTIEQAVTHYPESQWTGQALVLLTDFYYRTKRLSQAREILGILRQDFKKDKSVQDKVIIIERHLI